MLLRRVIEHVKAQNWTAVALDFFIVVIGVFMGIQLGNWNEARKEREREHDYVVRLHEEVVSLAEIRQPLLDFREETLTDLYRVARYVMNRDDTPITRQECWKIILSDVITNPTDDLAVIRELISAGQLDIFSDHAVSNSLAAFLSQRARATDAAGVGSSGLAPLRQKYPEQIRPIAINEAENLRLPVDVVFECESGALRGNHAFVADLIGNLQRYSVHIEQNRLVSARLAGLHAALDAALDLSHETETRP